MNILLRIINITLVSAALNCSFFMRGLGFGARFGIGMLAGLYFLAYNVFPTIRKYPSVRLRVLGDGAELLLTFFVSCIASAGVLAAGITELVTSAEPDIARFVIYAIILVIGEAVLFWNGIIRVYVTSLRLGLRYRVLGVVLGWVPIANLVMLMIIYVKVRGECRFECEKALLNESRAEQRVCATKYPILFVHGVFFRDSRVLNYWGRVPAELEKNGAVIYYGNQQSALAVKDSAAELAQRIREIVSETGCGKVNIIAHSKGGLDSRYAISKLGCAEYVASLTTVNTPHKGCLFAEYLLGKAPEKLKKAIEKTYNAAFRKLGDPNPDFMSAVSDLTNSFCEKFNKEVPNAEGVMYQSIGSKAARARSGRFPLNISYPVVKKFDGDNDGLVALSATEWGEKFTPLIPTGKRGITHADVIDLNREDIKGFDVREFYVGVVSELKERGF